MNNKGDDCYFYYYSTCNKGDVCPFRHCEAAMGNETVCSLWQENRCFRNVCKFRHMEIKKKRKEIPCYWENQAAGCQKFHCAFHHEKPRFIDGHFVAPDKGPVVKMEKEEVVSPDDQVSSASTIISNTTNPQRRGVIKVETQDSVPSPTHPPVVINPVDDEDDEDDQFSEGEEASGVLPKKLLSSSKDELHNFGVKTLKEIRLGKALNTSLNRQGHSYLQDPDGFTLKKEHNSESGTEKEPIHSVTLATVVATNETCFLEDSEIRKITDRLGKRFKDMPEDGAPRLKGSIAKRLGGFVDTAENKIDMPPKKVKTLKPVHDRLGISNSEPMLSNEIRIKTLDEILQEKAVKSQVKSRGLRVTQSISLKKINVPVSGSNVKTFSEDLHQKKKLFETKMLPQQDGTGTEKTECPSNIQVIKLNPQEGEIRVKTLEEIRKEKSARMQANSLDATKDKAPNSTDAVPKRRIFCVGRTGSAISIRSQKMQDFENMDCMEEFTVGKEKSDPSIQDVSVKSFDEIMREKRLRKQQEHAASAESEQATQGPIPVHCGRKPPAVIRPGIIIQGNSSTQQSINCQASSSLSSVVLQRKSPEMQNKENSLSVSPKKSKSPSSMALSVKLSKMADSLGQHSQEPHWDTQTNTRVPPSKAADLKVRPKLNVKPSVMKPAPQVKPGQKRKTAGIHCSAVAAVKPLSSVLAPDVEPPFKQPQLCAPSCSLEVERVHQMPSVAEQYSPEALSFPQSPVIKTPTQTRPRRASVASARGTASAGNSSTIDDFEDLLDEFTDDRLEDEIELDPGKGEDDLLLELSEMIDS